MRAPRPLIHADGIYIDRLFTKVNKNFIKKIGSHLSDLLKIKVVLIMLSDASEFYSAIDRSQLDLLDPGLQIFALHGDTKEPHFKSCLVDASGRRREILHSLYSLTEAARQEIKSQEYERYISPAAFLLSARGRRKTSITKMTVVPVDLDFHETEKYGELAPEEMVSCVFKRCDDLDLLRPNFIVFSGRGLQIYWIHKPLRFSHKSRQAGCERWSEVQQNIRQLFVDMGADPQGNNIVRVLRLVGSRSSRSKETVRILHVGNDVINGDKPTFFQLENDVAESVESHWDIIENWNDRQKNMQFSPESDPDLYGKLLTFPSLLRTDKENNVEAIADSFIPSRAGVVDLQAVREVEECITPELTATGKSVRARGRIYEILKLISGRHGGHLDAGCRNTYLFSIASLMTFLTTPDGMVKQMEEITDKLTSGAWSREQLADCITSVYKRAVVAQSNPEFGLKVYGSSDPRYWYKSKNLAGLLNVSEAEMDAYDLREIISPKRRQLNTKEGNKIRKRRQRGRERRSPAKLLRLERIEIAHKLRNEGMSVSGISKHMRMDRKTVRGYLSKQLPANKSEDSVIIFRKPVLAGRSPQTACK